MGWNNVVINKQKIFPSSPQTHENIIYVANLRLCSQNLNIRQTNRAWSSWCERGRHNKFQYENVMANRHATALSWTWNQNYKKKYFFTNSRIISSYRVLRQYNISAQLPPGITIHPQWISMVVTNKLLYQDYY